MRYEWNEEKKTYDIIFTPSTLFKGLDDGKPKYWATKPWKKEVVEVINKFKVRKLLESLGIMGVNDIQILNLYNSLLGKDNYCQAMINKAKVIRMRRDTAINITRDYFLYLMRSNDIEVLNWDVDYIGRNARNERIFKYSIEYNTLVYKTNQLAITERVFCNEANRKAAFLKEGKFGYVHYGPNMKIPR
jgi:hypothetical protein